MAGANLVAFTMLNLDYVLIGRHLGPAELGIYLLAFNLASLPSSLISAAIRTVAIPTFGRLHKEGSLGMKVPIFLAATAYLSFPVSALIVALAGPLVSVLYGETWARSSAAMVGLGIFGAGRILTETLSDLCVGAGKTGSLFWIQVIWLFALLPALMFGLSRGGIVGVSWGHAAVTWLIVVPVYAFWLSQSLKVPVAQIVRKCLWPFFASAVAGGAAWVVAAIVPTLLGSMFAGGFVGLGVYALLVFAPIKRFMPELKVLSTNVAPNSPERELNVDP